MKNIKDDARGLIGAAIIGVLIGCGLSNTVMCKVEVEGVSMKPTYETGNKLVINKLVKSPKRGDIVVFRHGKDKLIKRVIAIPGDTLMLEDSDVYVNGEKLSESYVSEVSFEEGNLEDGEEYVLGEDDYFVMGDNRNHSYDSRYFGFVEKDMIEGVKMFELK